MQRDDYSTLITVGVVSVHLPKQRQPVASLLFPVSKPHLIFFGKRYILARRHLKTKKIAYLRRDKKTVMMTTLFNVGTFFRGGAEARGKPICAMQAKMFCSLKKSEAVRLLPSSADVLTPSPLLKLLKQNQQILFLVSQVLSKERLAHKFRFQVADLDNQTLAFFVMLKLKF